MLEEHMKLRSEDRVWDLILLIPALGKERHSRRISCEGLGGKDALGFKALVCAYADLMRS
jgi:hypothetical protein